MVTTMAKYKGGSPYGSGMGNMNNMLKQAQKLQEDMAKAQEDLEQKTVSASVGGGVVEAVVSGKRELLSITINPQVVDPEDIETLQDLVLAAVNEALKSAEEMSSNAMSKLTGGMNIPGLF